MWLSPIRASRSCGTYDPARSANQSHRPLWNRTPVAAGVPATPTTRNNAMGELYNRMARDLALKNLAVKTQKEYLRCCCHFVRYHMTSPTKLGETEIKEYLGHLQLKGAGPETLKMNVAALKFLYGVT